MTYDGYEKLRAFAREILTGPFDDVDGNTLMSLGRKHGLLEPIEVDKACGDDCECDALGNIPGDCWRWSAILRPGNP